MPRPAYRKPRLERIESPKSKSSIGDGLSSLGSLIPHLSSTVLILPAITYVLGWRELSAYYTSIGASWIVDSLPPSAFLMKGAPSVTLFAVWFYISLNFVAASEKGSRNLAWGSAITMMVGLLCWFIGISETKLLAKDTVLSVGQAQSMTFVVSAAFSLAECTLQLSKNKMKWSSKTAYLLYSAIFFGAYIAPNNLGEAKAKLHLLPESDALPAAVLKVDGHLEQWRLVGTTGTTAFLISGADAAKTSRTFKVIELKEIVWVATLRTR